MREGDEAEAAARVEATIQEAMRARPVVPMTGRRVAAPLREMARRLDLEADRPEPERPQQRNVTMIPARGGRVVLRRRRG